MVAGNQQRIFLQLVAQLRPHWRRDVALPARIQSLLAGHREFGSRDRRLYRELLYTTLRHLPWIEPLLDTQPAEAVRIVGWLAAESPATKAFRAAHATGVTPAGDASALLPAWFRGHCPELFAGAELATQLRRAPLWLRLQANATEQASVFREFESHHWSWRRSEVLADAVEFLSEADVTQTDTWRNGWFEVQDLGSQLILATIGVERGGRWLDACAGAGGKTLQISRLVGPEGSVDAHDIRPAALEELDRRATRARQSVRIQQTIPDQFYDGVLVDAPCSGSGTWRRAPHLKWVTSEADIARAAATQRTLLDRFSAHVRPGGRLVYATCSLSSRENEDVVADFLAQHGEFEPAPVAHTFNAPIRGAGLLIFPSLHNTDGFFVASLRREAS